MSPEPARKAPPESIFDGLTPDSCCTACGGGICIISGDICIHPYKGGMQGPHRMKPKVIARFEEARNYLKHQAVDKRR